jgi:DNA-binding protein HU-beta
MRTIEAFVHYLKENSMNLNDLKDAVAEKAGISKADAGTAVSAVLDTISETLTKGEKIALLGFGNFEISDRAARDGRNPQTGETIKIAASKAVKFKAGKALKESVNG